MRSLPPSLLGCANFIKRYFSNYLAARGERNSSLARSYFARSFPAIFMGGVKRLEGINIKKCRGESKLAVLTSPPGEENWKTSIVGRYGEEKVERFKRDAIVDRARTVGRTRSSGEFDFFVASHCASEGRSYRVEERLDSDGCSLIFIVDRCLVWNVESTV